MDRAIELKYLLNQSKYGLITMDDNQWYEHLKELKNYVFNVKIPEKKEYLQNRKKEISSLNYFLQTYKSLGGSDSFPYKFKSILKYPTILL